MKKEEVKTGKKSPWQVLFFIIDFHEKKCSKETQNGQKIKGGKQSECEIRNRKCESPQRATKAQSISENYVNYAKRVVAALVVVAKSMHQITKADSSHYAYDALPCRATN